MFFFFLINGADKTNKAKCGQNKAELFPAFDSLAGKVPIRTPTFFAKPSCVVVKLCLKQLAQEIQLFFVAAELFVLFCDLLLALHLCDRLRVLSVRKEAAMISERQHYPALHDAAVWRSEKQQHKDILRQELSWEDGE